MAEKRGIPLSSITDFPSQAAERLTLLWITTAEEFVAAYMSEAGPSSLAQHLELPETELRALVDLAQDALPESFAQDLGEVETFGLGAMDEAEDEDLEPEEASFAPLPAQVDLHERMPPVRNQRNRGTCVSFSCTAVREYLLGEASAAGDLSEQFLYWSCKERDLYPGSGTWIKHGVAALEQQGICGEQSWPYQPNPIQGNEGQGPPPEAAVSEAGNWRISGSARLHARGVYGMRERLAGGLPIAFSVPVYHYWFTEPVRSSGDIRMPLSGEKSAGGHAMCMVGYEDDPDVPGGGVFFVRNSWGTSWARNSTLDSGYCRIPYAYIEQFGSSAYVAFGPPQPLDEEQKKKKEQPKPQVSWLDRFLRWLRGSETA